MKVAVMGAAGWVGRAVLKYFAQRHQVRAFDFAPQSWDKYHELDGAWDGEKIYGDIAQFADVDRALEGVDGVVNLTAYFGYEDPPEDNVNPFLINVKGMWNILEVARRRGLKRVVQMGSCVVQRPDGVFLSSEVRSVEGDLYGITKRLQEEVCRQFYDAHGVRSIVFRPCSIGDSRLLISRDGNPARGGIGWVCRHDLAQGCHLALENEAVDFDIMHVASHPEADKYCNTARAREALGLQYEGFFSG
ncbi:MAG: NAD-dependent epimerase/dehydratase family protein [Candidatus Latescibacteria bacterium]|nr:NAD-dependent epimerase/dehydratase family protein [Candidatus Latescibacterota bacterium]